MPTKRVKRKIAHEVEKQPYNWTEQGAKQDALRKETKAITVCGYTLTDLDPDERVRVMNYLIDLLDLKVVEDRDALSRKAYLTVR